MKKGGVGVGSASIVLVFALLCLTVFTLISLTSAVSDKTLNEAAVGMVTGYYEADTAAERVLDELLTSEDIPENIRGIAVSSYLNEETGAEIAEFSCPISDKRELYVEVAVFDGSYDILQWKMRETGEWIADESLNVWQG